MAAISKSRRLRCATDSSGVPPFLRTPSIVRGHATYDILIKDGYNVSIVQEPETSFEDAVAATKRVIALQDGPCILVAHSYGGAVSTEAGTDPSVAGLVYIAAHMPDAGENEADDGKRFPSDLKKTPDRFTYLDPA